MAFIKLSQEFKKESFVLLNSSFILDYMPNLPENAVKVYLLGLYFSTMDNDINTIENFSKLLNLSHNEIKNAYQVLEKEKEILRAQAINEGKPEAVVEKIGLFAEIQNTYIKNINL